MVMFRGRARAVLALVVWLVTLAGCSEPESPQGFAGLAEPAAEGESGFRQPVSGDRISLPGDWGVHPEYRIEWWYLTANLETAGGEPLGLQWTQFRQGLEPRSPDQEAPAASRWPLQSAWMAHGAVSFRGRHWFSERFARGDIGQAGARAEPLNVWLDHWQLQQTGPDRWQLNASGEDWSYQLELSPGDGVVRHGDQGFSAKTPEGHGSMYFSLTDIRMHGTVTLEGEHYPVEGHGWLDREWSSRFLRSDQRGWDWFALRLDDGSRLMAFRVGEGGGAFRSGTRIDPQGRVHSLASDEIALEVLEYRHTDQGRVPVVWRVDIEPRSLSFVVRAPAGEYWNDGLYPYWESPVSVTGSATGEGYMELTGYHRQ